MYAYGNSTVYAYGNSTVSANGNSTVYAYGNSTVYASKYVAVHLLSLKANVTGGVVIDATKARATPQDWCDFYGLAIEEGVVVLYKAVGDDYKTKFQGFEYSPGTVPVAPDWDGGVKECGGGLHFSPRPRAALEFDRSATKFVACPVLLSGISVHPNGQFPQKCKAKGCCGPVYEVDIDGNKL